MKVLVKTTEEIKL